MRDGRERLHGDGEAAGAAAPARKARLMRRRWWVLVVALVVAAMVGAAAASYVTLRAEMARQAQRLDALARELARIRQIAGSPPVGEPRTSVAEIYLTRATPQGSVELVAVRRPIPAPRTPEEHLRLVLEALLGEAGWPSSPGESGEGPPGASTQIPPGTKLLGARIRGETAYLDFSREFEQTAGSMRLAGMLRQVVFTATAVPPVRRVVLLVEGERVGTEAHPFTGDGLLFGELSRERLPL